MTATGAHGARVGGGGGGSDKSGGGNVTYYSIDASGADPAAIARLEMVIRELAGPGKTERRAVNAVYSHNARGNRSRGANESAGRA